MFYSSTKSQTERNVGTSTRDAPLHLSLYTMTLFLSSLALTWPLFTTEYSAGHDEAVVAVDSGVLADSPRDPVIDLERSAGYSTFCADRECEWQ